MRRKMRRKKDKKPEKMMESDSSSGCISESTDSDVPGPSKRPKHKLNIPITLSKRKKVKPVRDSSLDLETSAPTRSTRSNPAPKLSVSFPFCERKKTKTRTSLTKRDSSPGCISESTDSDVPGPSKRPKHKLNIPITLSKRKKVKPVRDSSLDLETSAPTRSTRSNPAPKLSVSFPFCKRKKTKTKTRTSLTKTSLKYKIQKRVREPQCCEICKKAVINIWRHMKVVHKVVHKANIHSRDDVIRSKKGYIIKRCPYKGCFTVVDRLLDHLVRKHKLVRKSVQIKRLLMRAESVPLTCDVPRKRQNIKKAIKQEDKIEHIPISSEDETVKVKKEKTSILSIKIEKEEIIEISSEEENSYEEMSDKNSCEQSYKEKSHEEEENSYEEMSDKNSCEQSYKEKSHEEEENSYEEMSDKNSCEQSYKEKSHEESSEESSSEESSSGDDSSGEGSSMIITEDSDEDYEEPEYYFQHTDIQQFIKYLQRPPYMKARKDALQHGCQVYQLWGQISKKRIMKELFNLDKVNDWLQAFLNDHAPGTARSYLSSLAMFVGHLVRQGFLRKGVGKALRFKEDLKLLSKQIRKKVQTRRTQIDVEEIETMITPEDFKEFWESSVATEAEEKLKGEVPQTVQPTDFLHIRNYLLLRILQTNAQRPGAIRNITQQSIERAHTDNDGAVVMIAEHKTSAQGPVNLGMTNDVLNMVRTYIQWTTKITGFQIDPKHPIFITVPIDHQFSGMTSNLINKAIQNIWKKGPVSNKSITATRIRKSTATHVRMAEPTSRESLAAHMTHSATTADRHYNIINQRNNAMTVTNLIAKVMVPMKLANIVELQDDTDTNSESEIARTAPMKLANIVELQDDTNCESEIARTAPMKLANIVELSDDTATNSNGETEIALIAPTKDMSTSIHWPVVTEMKKKDKMNKEDFGREETFSEKEDSQKDEDYREVDNDIVHSENDEEVNDSQKGNHRRRSFDPEEAKTLLDICRDNIKKGAVNLASILRSLEEDERGIQMLDQLKKKFGKAYLKKIVDRVRCEMRRQQKEQK